MITRLSLLAVLLALIVVGSARADVVRYEPESPSVAIGADGTTAVVWLRTGPWQQALMLAVRPAGGSFGKPVEIDAWQGEADLVDFRLQSPRVQLDARGNALVTWQRSRLAAHSSTIDEAWMRWRLRDGVLSSRLRQPGPSGARVTLSATGRAWIVASPGIGAGVASATPGAAFGAPHAIPQLKSSPELTATDDGGVLAIGAGDSGFDSLRLARLGADGGVRAVVDLVDETQPTFKSYAATAGGTVAVTYSRGAEIRLVTVPANSQTVTTQLVPGTEFGPRNIRGIGAADSGEVTLLWLRASNAAGREVVVRSGGGTFGPITALGPAQAGGGPSIYPAFARDGAALFVLVDRDGSLSAITRRPGGPFAGATRVTPAWRRLVSSPAVAIEPGRSLLAWVDGAAPMTPQHSRRLVVVTGSADGATRSDVLDSAVRDPNPPTVPFFVRQQPPARIDRRGRLQLTLSCPNNGDFVCDATLRIRRTRRGAVLARRTLWREPETLTRVRIALPRKVVRELRSGRRKTLWVTQRATRGTSTRDVPVQIGG